MVMEPKNHAEEVIIAIIAPRTPIIIWEYEFLVKSGLIIC